MKKYGIYCLAAIFLIFGLVLAACEIDGTTEILVPPTEITVTPNGTIELPLTGDNTVQLSFTVAPQGADTKVSYSSSATSVATVNSMGLVTAVGAGLTTITVKSDNTESTAETTVSVRVNAEEGGIAPDEIRLFFDNEVTPISDAHERVVGGTGTAADPFIFQAIFNGNDINLRFTVEGLPNANKNVQWQSWSNNGILVSETSDKVTLRGVNTNNAPSAWARFSVSSLADPSVNLFIEFQVRPPNPVLEFQIEPVTSGLHFTVQYEDQDGTAGKPYILGTTTGAGGTNTLKLTAVLQGAEKHIPANQTLERFFIFPSGFVNTLSASVGTPTLKTGTPDPDTLEMEITVTASGGTGGNTAILRVRPEGRTDLSRDIHFRVLAEIP